VQGVTPIVDFNSRPSFEIMEKLEMGRESKQSG
jgi:hypothetical protein